MLLLEIAHSIRCRLGEPTITALRRRFHPGGKCLSCGERLGSAPLSVRAYHDDTDLITLVAYHAECAASAWLEVDAAELPREGTWSAAVTSISLRVGVSRLSLLLGRRTHEQTLPVMLVHPSLEMARVRQVGPEEAVNAELEYYCRLGFADPGALSSGRRLPRVGQSWTWGQHDHPVVTVAVGGRAWSAPVCEPAVASLITTCGGTLIGITCERDPIRLSTHRLVLGFVIANEEVALGWAPLSVRAAPNATPRHPG